MQTILGKEIPRETKGVVYLCKYNFETHQLLVVRELCFQNSFDALNVYANTPNAESQIAIGKTTEEFEVELKKLHSRMLDFNWRKRLADFL